MEGGCTCLLRTLACLLQHKTKTEHKTLSNKAGQAGYKIIQITFKIKQISKPFTLAPMKTATQTKITDHREAAVVKVITASLNGL